MPFPPTTSYVKSRGVHIAYQVFGEGRNYLFIPGGWHHVEYRWEEPSVAESFRRLNRFCRVAVFDRHGCGLSDRSVPLPSLEEQVDDVLAVMDIAGMDEAIVEGYLDGGALALIFAAHHPKRVTRLILESTPVRVLEAPDYPFGMSAAAWGDLASMFDSVSTSDLVQLLAPGRVHDERFAAWFGKYWLHGAGPGGVKALMEQMAQVDLRPLLARVSAPTLVLHREGDLLIDSRAATFLADHLPDARVKVLSGADHAYSAGDVDAFIDAIEEFVTGEEAQRPLRRAVRTVLFTDIVDSTTRAADLGDQRWREILDAHDDLTGKKIHACNGRLIGRSGDGLLATFEDPFDGVQCALDLVSALKRIGVDIRAGLHTGQLEIRGDDVGGLSVHIGARVGAKATAGEVLVSRTLRDLLTGSGLRFDARGSHELKGIPDVWELYAVRIE